MHRHSLVTQLEFLNALERARIRIVKKFSSPNHRRRGLWEWWPDGVMKITVAWESHRKHNFAHDMVDTVIHEVIHNIRQSASEAWTRKHSARLYIDPVIRAAAAIKLLDVTYFDGEGDK